MSRLMFELNELEELEESLEVVLKEETPALHHGWSNCSSKTNDSDFQDQSS